MQVVPAKLCELAQQCLNASEQVSDAWSGAQGALQVAGSAAGNSDSGPVLLSAHGKSAEAAAVALGRLGAVLEQDMDALYQCAFDFSSTDEDQAATYESSMFSFFGLGGGA